MLAQLDVYSRTQLADGRYRWRCGDCGFDKTCRTCVNLRHQCPGPKPTPAPKPKAAPLVEPSLAQKAVNFTKAAARHVVKGLKEATDEQVAERFAICQACELFKPKGEGQGVCTHSSCGCKLKAVGLAGKNKLKWASEKCPIGKWGEV